MTRRRRPWSEIREEFREVVYREGAAMVAFKMRTHKATIYRLVRGDTSRPSGPVRAAAEEIVANATESEATLKPSPVRPLPPKHKSS